MNVKSLPIVMHVLVKSKDGCAQAADVPKTRAPPPVTDSGMYMVIVHCVGVVWTDLAMFKQLTISNH